MKFIGNKEKVSISTHPWYWPFKSKTVGEISLKDLTPVFDGAPQQAPEVAGGEAGHPDESPG